MSLNIYCGKLPQCNLSNVDTIGITYACIEYEGACFHVGRWSNKLSACRGMGIFPGIWLAVQVE